MFILKNILNTYNRLAFVILVFFITLSQQGIAAQNKLLFHHVSTSEGLPNNHIKWITADRFGYVWIATENGIAQFDGSGLNVFKSGGQNSYGPAGGNVHFMQEINGVLWIGATTGLSSYNYLSKKWSRIPILYNKEINLPTPTYIYPFHIDDENAVWMYVGYYGSICKYYPTANKLEIVTEKSNGRIYTPDDIGKPLTQAVSLLPHGIYTAIRQDGKWTEKSQFSLSSDFAFFAERAYHPKVDELWLATDKGLVCTNPQNNQSKLYEFPSPLTAIAADKINSNYLWIGSQNDGVFCFDKFLKRIVQHMEHDAEDAYSLRSNQITFLHADSLGRLFVGLSGKGMAYADVNGQYFKSSFTRYDAKKQNSNNSISHIFPLSDSSYLAASNSGLMKFSHDGNLLKKISTSNEQIYSGIKTGYNVLLFQSSSGFYKYDTFLGKIVKYNKYPESLKPYVFSWIQLSDGSLYAATDRGFYEIVIENNTLKFQSVKFVNEILDFTYIQFAFSDENDNIYLKTNYTDFAVFSYKDKTLKLLKKYIHQNYVVNDISTNPKNTGELLLATSAGIKIWNKKNVDWSNNQNYLNENVISISNHPVIGTFIGTDNGLFRYDEKKNVFEHFGIENGISSEQFTPAHLVFSDKIVLGSVNGFTSIPVKTTHTSTAPKWISNSAHEGSVGSIRFSPFNFSDTLIVQEGFSSFDLDVSIQGIPLDNGGYLSYTLNGADDIIHVVHQNATLISYDRLAPGVYNLSLSYQLKWPIQKKYNKNVLVIVKPAFYQTTWFSVLSFLLFVVIIIGLFRFVLYRQKIINKRRMQVIIESQEQERTRIAADLHDDLGGKLSTLKLLLQETGRQNPNLKNFNLYSGSMELLDHSISDLRTALFNLNPRTLSESGVFAALSHLCMRIDSSGELSVHIQISDEIKNLRLLPEVETVIYRLAQELINNTIKHAKASQVDVSFEINNNQLSISYSDNGKGFDEELVEKGLGLQNIKTRVHLVNGRVQFQTAVGKGLKVFIFIPINTISNP